MEERVNIVDENDEVIGEICKKEAHEQGLLHRTVIAEVKDSQNRWLMVKQAGDKQDAGQFVSPVGGHVATGERVEDAIIRETKEEIGIEGFKYRLVGKAIFNREVIGRKENHLFILFEIQSDQIPVLNEAGVEFRYFTDEELKMGLRSHPDQFGEAFHFVVRKFYPHLIG